MGKNSNTRSNSRRGNHDNQQAKRQRQDDEQVSEIYDSITSIDNSESMDKLIDKLLNNSLFCKSIHAKLDIPNTVKDATKPLLEQLSHLTRRVDDLEQYSRRTCLKVAGIPEQSGENTDDLLINLFKDKLNIPLSYQDISRSHRVDSFRRSSNRPRDIIIRFNSYRTRAQVYDARFQLKPSHHNTDTPRIFINEALTAQRARVFAKARGLVRDRVAHKAFTKDGSIIVRDLSDKNHKLTTIEQLDALFPLNSDEAPRSFAPAGAPGSTSNSSPGLQSPISYSTPRSINPLTLSVTRGTDGTPVAAAVK
ncbi:uncharacterized protein [Argopecten irradians]|uniref:uncharacterized protein n=1 Tax=Argopecten irradians TaxID=31199 RepID=UPI0037203BA6